MPSDPVLLDSHPENKNGKGRCEYDPDTPAIEDSTDNNAYFDAKSRTSSCWYAPECTRIRDPIRGGSLNPDCLSYADVKETDGLKLNHGQTDKADAMKERLVQIGYPLAQQGKVTNDVGVKVDSNQSGPNVATTERGSSNFKKYQAEFTSLEDYSEDNPIVKEALENIHQANIRVLNDCTIAQNDLGYKVFTKGDDKCGKPCGELTASECKLSQRGNYCNYQPLAICTKDLDPDTGNKRSCGEGTAQVCGPCVEFSNGLAFDDPKQGKTTCYETKANATANDGTSGKIACENAIYRTIQTQPTDFRVEMKDTTMNEWRTIDVQQVQSTANNPLFACVFGSVDAHKSAVQACGCTDDNGTKFDFSDVSYRGAQGLKNLAIDVYDANERAYDANEALYTTQLTGSIDPDFVTNTVIETADDGSLTNKADQSRQRIGKEAEKVEDDPIIPLMLRRTRYSI